MSEIKMTPEQFQRMFPDVNAKAKENALDAKYTDLRYRAMKYLRDILVPMKEIGGHEIVEVHNWSHQLVFILAGGSYAIAEAKSYGSECDCFECDEPLEIDQARDHHLLPDEMGEALDEAAAALREHDSEAQAARKLKAAIKELGSKKACEILNSIGLKDDDQD